MIRLVLLVVLLFLFTLPSSSTSPSSPSKTQQGLVINQLAVPNQDLSESKSTELIDQRWQVAAKEWGAWAQVGLQTWGGKVGEWGHAGAEKLKASELASEFGKGFKKLPGVWHASVAAVEKVLPERGRGEMVSEEGRVKESERFGKLGAEMREASREREKEGQAEEAGALRDLEAGRGGAVELVDGEASKRSGEKSWVTKRDPDKRHAVQERSDSCAEVAEPVAKKAKTSIVEPQGKPDGETDNGVARGVQSGLAPQAASFQGDVEIGRAEGRHSERPVVWGVRELENDRQKSRGIPPKRAQDAKATVGQASSEGGQEGELGREIGVDAKRARKSGGDLDGAQVERGPAVRSVEGRSVVEFEEWLQRERLRKAALDESPDVAEISNPGTVSGEKEREGFDVVVLLVGGLCLGCVFWVVRMLSRGSRWVAGCLRGRIDSSQGEETPALVLKEGLVSAEMEGVMGRVSNGLEEVSETYRDRSGQQLGAALGSATGSLMAEVRQGQHLDQNVTFSISSITSRWSSEIRSARPVGAR